MTGFFIIAGVLFTVAFFVASHYMFSVPEQQEASAVAARLRELRTRTGGRGRGSGGGDLLKREQKGTFAFLGDFVAWLGILRRLQEYIDQAALKYRAIDVFVVSLLLFVGMFLLLGLVGLSMVLLRITFSLVIAFIPLGVILQIRKRRLSKFENLLPDAIDLFNRSMKAGHTIHSGLETIASESVQPVLGEFKKVIEELALGSQLEAALLNLGKRVPLIDLKFFITAINLQRQTGANMVEVLDNLALLVRERLNMVAKMKAHTSQQRLSAGLLCGLPVLMGLVFWIFRPEMMGVLVNDDFGSKVFTFAIVWELIGILVIRRVANPKF